MFSLLIFLCALSTGILAQIQDLTLKEENIHRMRLHNGISAFIQERTNPPDCATIQVVFKKLSGEEAQYAWEYPNDRLKPIDQFFEGCANRAEHLIGASIVAIGDFNMEYIEGLVEKHFGSLQTVQCVNDADEPDFEFAENYVIPISNPATANEPFFQLPLTEKEKRLIKIIISTMADKNIIQLAIEKRTLEKKGKKVNHVHPLRFIGFIVSNPHLREDLKIIKKSSFKWDAFIDGFSKRMREELANGNVYQHVPGFASQVGASPEHVNHYISKKDWEGLVKSLL